MLMQSLATASLAPLLDTVFVPASLQDFSSAGASDELASIDAAFARTARSWPSTGILAGFTERPPPRRSGFWRLGQAQYLGRRMLVRLEPGATESRTLLHEILHLYGGVHVAEEMDSLLNPSGSSLELDPANQRIVIALREREFGPGGLEANVMPQVDAEELTDSLTGSLRLPLHFRRLGVLAALEMRETSRFAAARGVREARELDPHLASVSRFVATLLIRQRRYAEAARFLEGAARIQGPRTSEGQLDLRRARALWRQAARKAEAREPTAP